MSSSTQVILLERVENLGNMGEVVSVKPGFARNFLLPQKKALRASKENVAYFEAQKKVLEAENEKSRKEADKLAKKIEGVKVAIIRQASESGQLFGSVNARDIADAVAAETKEAVNRTMVRINDNFKTIGLYNVELTLHPEVKVEVVLNVARSAEEAKLQAELGRALTADAAAQADADEAAAEEEVVAEEAATESSEEATEETAA